MNRIRRDADTPPFNQPYGEHPLEAGIDSSGGEVDRLPARGEADHDFDLMRDVLLRDLDVLMLFDMSMDGIEDPYSEVARIEGTTNLHRNQWFLPLDDAPEGA